MSAERKLVAMPQVGVGTTAAERRDLKELVRRKAAVAKRDADARKAEQIAEAEAMLAKKWDAEDAIFQGRIAELNARVAKLDEEARRIVPEVFADSGIPKALWPEYRVGAVLLSRGENAEKERRAELRAVARSTAEADCKRAVHEIERWAVGIEERIVRSGLTSDEALALIDAMPTPAALMPIPTIDALEDGAREERKRRRQEADDLRRQRDSWYHRAGLGAGDDEEAAS